LAVHSRPDFALRILLSRLSIYYAVPVMGIQMQAGLKDGAKLGGRVPPENVLYFKFAAVS
jgi:hypothetical protein